MNETVGSETHRRMWEELGMNLELHDRLLEGLDRSHQRMIVARSGRPAAMGIFDEAFHDSHSGRVADIVGFRKAGGRSIGTFCIYVPDEIAFAAGVAPMALCGGSAWAVDQADRLLPRDICPLVRSTFGMSVSGTCPYKTLKDFGLGETTCDAKKKAWDLVGFPSLELPQRKSREDRDLWMTEVRRFAGMMEDLSGASITVPALREGIRLGNRRREILREINETRRLPEPPISGLDALLVSQAALAMDVRRFIEAGEELLEELGARIREGRGAYSEPGPRVLYAGSPSPMGFAKIHFILETSRFRVVSDESCTGARYWRGVVDDSPDDVESLLGAIADRYFAIDCACFSPNADRLDNIRAMIRDWSVDAVVHGVLQYCHGFDIESRTLDRALSKDGIPTFRIVTDYSEQDEEQTRVRVEAFREMVEGRSSE